jgi:hypothetical protein
VVCSAGFKTFILSLPFVNGTNGSLHVLSPSAAVFIAKSAQLAHVCGLGP